jgi:hypothetical protein
MKNLSTFFYCLFCLFLTGIWHSGFAQGSYELEWRPVKGLDLPSSIQVYETRSSLSDSLPFYAVYTLVDLKDPNIQLKARYVGDNNKRMTPQQFAGLEEEPVFVLSNGGFFSATKSASLVVEDAKVLATGPQSITSESGDCAGTAFYPTHGAFGVWQDRKMDVSWVYADANRKDTILSYPTPNPNLPCDEPGEVPDATSPSRPMHWKVKTAMGGIPVLISNGEIVELDKEMAASSLNDKHPRTAVGYTRDHKMILLVVDGRQEEHSRGATLEELARMMDELGAYEALNLDGGGSSAMMAGSKLMNKPSDITGPRPVASALLITRKALIMDTEDQAHYKESARWKASEAAGASKSRILPTGDGSGKAVYTLGDIPPARYELSAWWAPNEKLSKNAPFTIRRSGIADSLLRFRLDQSAPSTADTFNYIGTFDLGPGDEIIISNDAGGEFVAVDAIRLRKIGESKAEILFSDGEEQGDFAAESTISIPLRLQSPNTGVKLKALRVYQSVNRKAEELTADPVPLNGTGAQDYAFSYSIKEAPGSLIDLRFELEDEHGRKVSRPYALRVMNLGLLFEPNRTGGKTEAGRMLAFDVKLENERKGWLQDLQVYKSVNGGVENLQQHMTLSQKQESLAFSYPVKELPGDVVRLRFLARTSSGETSERTYEAMIVPAKGHKRIAFISDINSAYGSTDYSSHARAAMEWIADVDHEVDLVLGSGDFIAGQSRSLNRRQVEAMWAAFGRYVFDPVRHAGIPFGFSLGNHDANLELDREVALAYWKQGTHQQDLQIKLIDSEDYPFRYTFSDPEGEIFVITLDMNSQEDQLAWVEAALQSAEAAGAKYVFVSGHFPLFALTKVYNSQGGVQANYQALFELFRKYEVDMFFSGHHATYFPGKKKELFQLSVGEMGGDGRDYVGTSIQAPSSLSIMDIFEDDPVYGDSLVLSTYDIQDSFKIVKNEALPAAVFGFNGYTLRRDIAVSATSRGVFSSLNLEDAFVNPEAGGDVQMQLQDEEVRISGTFHGLEGKLRPKSGAVVLCQGLHPDQEVLLNLKLKTREKGRSGSFEGTFKPDDIAAFKELMSVGNYSVLIKTSKYPEGELRSQLYPAHNQAPDRPRISSHSAEEVYGVRDLIAYFTLSWEAVEDAESNRITYLYQLAEDPDFENIIWQQGCGRNTTFKRTEQEWYTLTDSQDTSIFYQRVIATDGRNIVYGAPEALHLRRDNSPPTELVEIPAPPFKYKGIFANMGTGSKGYDIAAYDKHERLWATSYAAGLFVYHADGGIHKFNSPQLKYSGDHISHITFKGVEYSLNPAYGVEIAPDGHIILAAGGQLFKLNVENGEPIAHWGGGAGSNPTVDEEGRIFVHKVFPAKAAWILQQSRSAPDTFEVLASPSLHNGPEVARSSAFAPDGHSLYLPDASASRKVYKYKSEDGLHFVFDQIIEMAFPTGSNAIYAGAEDKVYVVANRGEFAPDLLFVDFRNNYFWRLPLEDIPVSDLRGFTVTKDAKAFFLTGAGLDIYHYKLEEEAEVKR